MSNFGLPRDLDGNNNPAKYYFDRNEILKAFNAIQVLTNDVHEVRILKATTTNYKKPHTLCGYFDNANDLVNNLTQVQSAMGVFITPNPCIHEIRGRSNKRLSYAESTTQDTEILRLNWLLLDADAIRPAGISSSEEEHAAAHARLQEVLAYLRSMGVSSCIEASSGNGAHGLLRIELAVSEKELVNNCLKALSARFSDDVVKIDTSVGNPARIWKLYGTLACKGDPLPDRPHRLARILSLPETLIVTPREVLEAIAATLPSTKPNPNAEKKKPVHDQANPPAPPPTEHAYDIEAFVQRHDLKVKGPYAWEGGRRWVFQICPWRESDGEGAYLIQHANGAVSAGCHHETCPGSHLTGNHWLELKAMYEGSKSRSIQQLQGAELDAALARLNQTEYGLAERFQIRYGDVCRFVEDWKSWVVFDGARWVQSNCDAKGFAMRTVKHLLNEAHHLGGGHDQAQE